MNPNQDIDDISSMLGLDEYGVSVTIRDTLRVGRSQAAGHYSPWKCIISINRAILPYWVTSFTTMLHEFRHHLQRTWIIATMVVCIGVGLISWLYGMLVHSNLFIYIFPLAITAAGYLAKYYSEWDARRYERGNLSGIMLAIQALEHTWIAWTLGLQRTTRNNLRRLHKEIQKSAPLLLEGLSEDQEVVGLDAR